MALQRFFNSKILLFGEYNIIKNGRGLSIPFDLFSGKLSFRSSGRGPIYPENSTRELKAFSDYIKDLKIEHFDIDSFKFDIENGLFFDSTIPYGFGVGSSGALTAAVFDRYVRKNELDLTDLIFLKNYLGKLESHFHGVSSGLDPLISYLNQPLLIHSSSVLEKVQLPDYKKGKGALFLLNTERARQTGPLVNLFIEKLKHGHFSKVFEDTLIPVTDSAISSFLNSDTTKLFYEFKSLSQLQMEYFSSMIPTHYLKYWKLGLKTESYFLKLCGAGGGGFFLGIACDFEEAKLSLKNLNLRPIFFFEIN